MNSSDPDYERIYREQDKVLDLLAPALSGFYLTGGTALGRFYLGHRYSDDLDFFVNSDPAFRDKTEAIFELLKGHYRIGEAATVKADSFIRIWLAGDAELKL